jgi:hypothetical protein
LRTFTLFVGFFFLPNLLQDACRPHI